MASVTGWKKLRKDGTMFRAAQKQLTILYTVFTGIILLLLLALIFYRNITVREQQEITDFNNLWLSVSSRLQSDAYISDSYLAQTEVMNRSIIYIEENGLPLFFSGAWMPPSGRTSLIRSAFDAADAEGVNPRHPPVSSFMSQTSLLQLKGSKGDSYYGRIMVLTTEHGAKCLLLLSYITPRLDLVFQSLPLFALSGAVGLAGILIISWFLTGRALLPARESVKRQTEFVAAASHELRSPLAVIRSSLSALQGELTEKLEGSSSGKLPGDSSGKLLGDSSGKLPDDSSGKFPDGEPDTVPLPAHMHNITWEQLIGNADRECQRMARLVSDMLLLASSDAGTWALHRMETEPDTLLIEAYEAFLPICREKNICLTLALPQEPLPPLLADKQRLQQVIAILLDNAVSYTPAGESISLKMYKKESGRHISSGLFRTVIEIADSGKGIPDEMKSRIFDRFYRGDSSRNDKKHFGLGLSIAKELVEMHGGTIAVYDNPEGGSRFVITLTLQKA